MTGSVSSLAVRMIISLGVVLGLMWVIARVLTSRNGVRGLVRPGSRRAARSRPVPTVRVVARTSVSKAATVAVVEACGRTMVLGVTAQGINVLASDDTPLDLTTPVFADNPESGALDSPLLDVGRSLVPTAGRMPTSPGWKPVLDALRERTVRRP